MKTSPCKRGFTLIELVMVIVILGILMAFSLPKYINLSDSARISAAKSSLGSIRAAIAMKYAENAGSGGVGAVYPDTINVMLFAGGRVPSEPFHNSNAIVVDDGPPTASVGGWMYNNSTGHVWINDTALDSRGVQISTY